MAYAPLGSTASRFLSRSHKCRHIMSASQCRKSQHIAYVTPEADKIPYKGDFSREKCDLRRQWVEKYVGVNLPNISKWWTEHHSPEILKGNLELPIGTISIPMAAVGPLQINGKHAQGKILAPFPTTEGLLVASINRGAKVLNECGGVTAHTSQKRMSRGPVFKTGSAEEALALGEWVKGKIPEIQEQIVSKHSNHAVLKEIITAYDFENVHMLLNYETGDAAGHNMAAFLSWKAIQWVDQERPKNITVENYWMEGIMAGDKRCSHFNAVIGRGLSCGAEAILSEDVLKRVFRTTTEKMMKLYNIMVNMAIRSHAMGANANISNVIAAMFAATGQDMASAVESSMGSLVFNKNDGPEGGIKTSVWIPSLAIGTVGGGTSLPTQRECLEMMDCYGPGKVRKLGEIIAAYVLALEISTFASNNTGELAEVHQSMTKKRPT